MKIINANENPNDFPHLNRFVDLTENKIYLIESVEDYILLPASIKEMLLNSPVVLDDGSESNQLYQLQNGLV